ncbi:MAG: hypothetical protein PHR83_18680 [Paludibacter sp.]|nr:hypothetical protein [Paludibacter sp.]
MEDVKINREFSERQPQDKEWLAQNTWCDFCKKADLGIEKPTEFELNGKIYLSGFCSKCGNEIKSEIIE